MHRPAMALVGRGSTVLAVSFSRALSTSRPICRADKVAHGFSSPGNSGVSEEMKEVGRDKEVAWNDESTQRHQFSEKMRFDEQRYDNPQAARGAEAMPGDTSSGQALSERSAQTAPGQTHGAVHHSQETLRAARQRGPGEYVDTASDMPEEKPVEEAAAVGEGVLLGSKQGMAPNQPRGFHTAACMSQEQGGGEGPGVRFPSEEENADLGNTRRPDPPDERAPAYEGEEAAAGEDRAEGEGSAADPDEVMERRVADPEVGGLAS